MPEIAERQEWSAGKLLSEVQDRIGHITINQPEKRNAISTEMWSGLEAILDSWENDSTVRAVVLTGAGEKAFASGADISQFEKLRSNAVSQREYDRATASGLARLASFSKPVISQIRGFCLGGGVALAIGADLRIASEDAQFGIPAARIGASYGFDRIRNLVSLVGHANARMLLFTGARIDAAEALRIGLVHRVVKNDALTPTVADLAHAIATNAPLSLRASKAILEQVLRDPANRDLAAVQRATDACFDSNDYREGRTAFMEKRAPQFRGQ